MKRLLLVILIVSILFFFKWPVLANKLSENLAARESVQIWSLAPKELSEPICREETKQVFSEDNLASRPNNASRHALYYAARQAYFEGDCDSAFHYWNLVLENDPQDSTGEIMRFLSSGLDHEFMPKNVSKEVIATYLFRLGLQAEENHMKEQASYWFANAFELRPSRAAAEHILPLQQNPDEMAHIWQELSKNLEKNDSDYWWSIGQYAELKGEWDLAVEAYTAGASISPRPYKFLVRQGKNYVRLEVLDKAAVSYQRASLLQPSALEPLVQLGHIYRQQRDFDDAKSWYEKALNVSPNHFPAIFFLGLSHFQLEDDVPARKYLQRALDLKPAHAESAYYLAHTLKRSGDSQAAMEYLEHALDATEKRPWAWLMVLGDWRHASGDVAGALAAYEEALRQQSENAALQSKIKAIKDIR